MESNRKGTIFATYELTPQVETIDKCLDLLLHEMTSGIMYYSTRNGTVMDRVRDHVPFVDDSVRGEVVSRHAKEDGAFEVTFSLPAANVDPRLGGITNLWPMVAGEVFNFYFIKKARLLDLKLPQGFTRSYKGPGSGIRGIRERVNAGGGPLFGAIIKPNLGLDPGRAAQAAANLADAGFDFLKDDEICVNPDLCPLAERVRGVARALDEACQRTGRKVLYMANVTTDFASLEQAASTAVAAGAGGFMIDPFCTGLSAIDFLRRKFDAPIYVHRVGYGLHSLGRDYSVSYELFTRLFRLLGADFSHVGGIWGGAADARQKVARYLHLLRDVEPGNDGHRETWPVVSGITTESMGEYHGFYGDDTLFLEHIDIYRSASAARDKLAALKSRLVPSAGGGAR